MGHLMLEGHGRRGETEGLETQTTVMQQRRADITFCTDGRGTFRSGRSRRMSRCIYADWVTLLWKAAWMAPSWQGAVDASVRQSADKHKC